MALREWCKRLTDWWFSSESFDPMGIIRLVFVGAVALPRLDDDLERLAQAASYPAGLIDPPTIINVLPFAFPLSPEAIALLGALMHGALILAFVGLLTRPALLFASLAYLYVGAAAAAMGTFNHALSLIVMVLLVAAVAPGSDAWSLDRLLRALLQGKRTLRECMSFLAMPSTSG